MRTVAHRARLAGLALAFAAVAQPAHAQWRLGQSFTVGSPNTVLTQFSLVNFGARASTPLFVDIFRLAAGEIVGASLASQSLGTTFDGFVLNLNLPLSVGMYAVLVTIPPTWLGYSVGTPANTYAGGSSLECFGTTCSKNAAENDIGGFAGPILRIGDVSPPNTPVPEPSTFALFGVGLLVTAIPAIRRRRDKGSRSDSFTE